MNDSPCDACPLFVKFMDYLNLDDERREILKDNKSINRKVCIWDMERNVRGPNYVIADYFGKINDDGTFPYCINKNNKEFDDVFEFAVNRLKEKANGHSGNTASK